MQSAFSNLFFSVYQVQRPVDIKNRPKIPIPDEDPYSEAAGTASSSGSSGLDVSAGEGKTAKDNGLSGAAAREQLVLQQSQQTGNRKSEKPPKLPPRDAHAFKV